MVRKSGVARRSSKRGSQISALKHLSLLDPAPAEPPLLQTGSEESPVCPDRVYLHAAAIFQSTHLEKPPAHRLISYGKRSEVRLPVAKDEASQRSAYQLAFNTLKYQELLEDVLIDSCFCLSQPMVSEGRESVCVFRTKLVASLARCRIKHELLTLENMVPEQIRHREERATLLPLYGWINSLRSRSSTQNTSASSHVEIHFVRRQSKYLCFSDVKLLPDSLESLDVSDVRLQKISVVFLMPACSLSAISNPVDYIIEQTAMVLCSVLTIVLLMPVCVCVCVCVVSQVGAVLYSTCSVHPEENEEVLKTVLSQTQENHSTAPRVCVLPPQNRYNSVSDDFRLSFFSLSPAQPEPEVIETPQEVLARAAAKGLLDGLHPNQPIQKEGRGRRSRRAPANQKRSVKTRPHATQSDQSRVAEFLDREMKGSRSEPTLSQSPRRPAHYGYFRKLTKHPVYFCISTDKPFSSQRPSQSGFSRTGSAPSPVPISQTGSAPGPAPISQTGSAPSPAPISQTGSAPSPAPFSRTGSAPSPAPFSSSYRKSLTRLAAAVVSSNDNHSSPPPAPPKGRQEVLRPATVTFPPVLLSSNDLLPQRGSHAPPARPSPAHTYLQWRNSTPALTRSQTPFRLNHLRPWL
uniref:SAM-dependent methyltransferase RsmB-F/NOP2-type catalytic core domain-containing protein n=1 Tax=Cyprinus carpio TaxID=7962 RepID=A0A8C2EY16_CYPCA